MNEMPQCRLQWATPIDDATYGGGKLNGQYQIVLYSAFLVIGALYQRIKRTDDDKARVGDDLCSLVLSRIGLLSKWVSIRRALTDEY